MKEMNASEFKTRCFAVLEEVKLIGETIIILKHGRLIAEFNPARTLEEEHPLHKLKGSIEILGDLI